MKRFTFLGEIDITRQRASIELYTIRELVEID
jgi:hypothetical protein